MFKTFLGLFGFKDKEVMMAELNELFRIVEQQHPGLDNELSFMKLTLEKTDNSRLVINGYKTYLIKLIEYKIDKQEFKVAVGSLKGQFGKYLEISHK